MVEILTSSTSVDAAWGENSAFTCRMASSICSAVYSRKFLYTAAPSAKSARLVNHINPRD